MNLSRFEPTYDHQAFDEILRRASAERSAAAGQAIVQLVQGAQGLVLRLVARIASAQAQPASGATGEEFSRVA